MSREGGFPDPAEPLDAGGARDAARCTPEARFHRHVLRSPARVAGETALAMGLAASIEPALADIGHGRWSGRSFTEIGAAEPEALAGWIADPVAGAPEGETMEAVRQRIGQWLDGIAAADEPVLAITHPMPIRAALAHTLDLPLRKMMAIDVAPLSRTVLSFNRIWRLQALGCGG